MSCPRITPSTLVGNGFPEKIEAELVEEALDVEAGRETVKPPQV